MIRTWSMAAMLAAVVLTAGTGGGCGPRAFARTASEDVALMPEPTLRRYLIRKFPLGSSRAQVAAAARRIGLTSFEDRERSMGDFAGAQRVAVIPAPAQHQIVESDLLRTQEPLWGTWRPLGVIAGDPGEDELRYLATFFSVYTTVGNSMRELRFFFNSSDRLTRIEAHASPPFPSGQVVVIE